MPVLRYQCYVSVLPSVGGEIVRRVLLGVTGICRPAHLPTYHPTTLTVHNVYYESASMLA